MKFQLPWLTITVLLVTAAFTTTQFFVPDLLPALRRQPSMLTHGEIWRFATAWLVHDEGLRQISFNFPLLAVVGSMAEFAFDRRAWIGAYVLAGLTGEIAGLFWQPIGAGNSVAVLGLVGLAAGGWGRAGATPMARGVTLACLAMAAVWLLAIGDIHGPALLAGLLFGQIASRVPAFARGNS